MIYNYSQRLPTIRKNIYELPTLPTIVVQALLMKDQALSAQVRAMDGKASGKSDKCKACCHCPVFAWTKWWLDMDQNHHLRGEGPRKSTNKLDHIITMIPMYIYIPMQVYITSMMYVYIYIYMYNDIYIYITKYITYIYMYIIVANSVKARLMHQVVEPPTPKGLPQWLRVCEGVGWDLHTLWGLLAMENKNLFVFNHLFLEEVSRYDNGPQHA